MTNKTTAIFLTGASARISQEVAILDLLMKNKGLVLYPDKCLLAGFSSGALNLSAINSCFSKGSKNNWDTYYKEKILFPLQNKDVYLKRNLLKAPFELSVYDTIPLRKTIEQFVSDMNCNCFGDFSFDSFILTCIRGEYDDFTQWAFSAKNSHGGLNTSDLLMASSAIPILFPPQNIDVCEKVPRNFPDGKFFDGGTEGAFINFQKHLDNYILDNGSLETLHVISPMRQSSEREFLVLKNILDKFTQTTIIVERLKKIVSNISMFSFLNFLNNLKKWNVNGQIKEVFISIPKMEKNFPIIDFDFQEEQYNEVVEWFEEDKNKTQLALPLDDFIKANPIEKHEIV